MIPVSLAGRALMSGLQRRKNGGRSREAGERRSKNRKTSGEGL